MSAVLDRCSRRLKSDGRLPPFVVSTHMHESGQDRAAATGELLTAEEVASLLRVTPA